MKQSQFQHFRAICYSQRSVALYAGDCFSSPLFVLFIGVSLILELFVAYCLALRCTWTVKQLCSGILIKFRRGTEPKDAHFRRGTSEL